MTEQLQGILKRKPSKWGNLTVKEFEGDIKLLQERVEELERENKKVKGGNFGLSKIINSKRKEINRLKQALEFASSELEYAHVTGDIAQKDKLIKDSINIIEKALEREG